MSLFEPGPQHSWRGRFRRGLSRLAHHHSRLHEVYEWSDSITAVLTAVFVLSWIRRWQLPEWLHTGSEGIHIVGSALIGSYVLLRLIFHAARGNVGAPHTSLLQMDDERLRGFCSADMTRIGNPAVNPNYDRDLDAAVHLCHEALGFEHDAFTTAKRRRLYDGWCRANANSMMLITPQFGSAKGRPIGVTIVLPLRAEGLRHMQQSEGGVLRLDDRHILPDGRNTWPLLLIDTLLLQDEWIPAYGPLAMSVLFHHVALFYNARTWRSTELYCCMFQGGAVGRYLPHVRQLIGRRGFHEFGRTAEGETIFRMCMRSLAADPMTVARYRSYVKELESCAASTAGGQDGSPHPADDVQPTGRV